nr:unnamed protein product [Callosobruchus chinensis]
MSFFEQEVSSLFLPNQDTPLDSISNIVYPVTLSNNEEENYTDESSEGQIDQELNRNTQEVFKSPTTSSNQPLSKKRKANDHATYMKKFMSVCTNALTQKEEVDEFMAIAINIAAKLKKMTSEQAYLSESLITQIITKGLFSKLTHNTIVTERPGNSHPDDSRCASHDSRTASYEDSHDSSSTTYDN